MQRGRRSWVDERSAGVDLLPQVVAPKQSRQGELYLLVVVVGVAMADPGPHHLA